jgi:hypothetical protein
MPYLHQVLKPKGSFKYLGLVLGNNFMIHLRDKLTASLRSISDIRHLQRMSVTTAMKLLRKKVQLTLTYGLKIKLYGTT